VGLCFAQKIDRPLQIRPLELGILKIDGAKAVDLQVEERWRGGHGGMEAQSGAREILFLGGTGFGR
jgi:hypothetical protein